VRVAKLGVEKCAEVVRRPSEWNDLSLDEKMNWLRKQRTRFNGGRKSRLQGRDKERVWSLLKEYRNISLVADLLGVHRITVHRFLKRFPVPKTFVVDKPMNLLDFPEMGIWMQRIKAFANQRSINTYLGDLRAFYKHMKTKHPERAKPSLWTSDDINEWIYSLPSHLWHRAITPLRSLKLKAPNEFPSIDLGLLPTKKTHAAKRSLAGVAAYYLEPEQINKMIYEAEEKRDKALLAFLFNVICRTSALTEIKVTDIDLKQHFAKVKDKGDITWLCYGLSEETCQFIAEYLEERGCPPEGYLFVNGNNNKLTTTQVNQIIQQAGQKAGVEGKVLTAKVFRKSLVKHALTPEEEGGLGMEPVSLIGTGKKTKTCFCVGWTEMKVLMEHYAPRLMSQIESDRAKFHFCMHANMDNV
jgi:site-specific recombinase XerD